MPVHEWTRVDAGIYHYFHHKWMSTVRRALNDGLLPPEYYALAEQQAAGFGPDVLTLHETAQAGDDASSGGESSDGGSLLLVPPRTRFTAQSASEFYRHKRSTIVVRHVSGDDIVAVVELVSPGNKASRNALRALIAKACELLEHKIHLLILDLFPPTKRDANGQHAALWVEIADEPFTLPVNQPLSLASYESGPTIKVYVETLSVGDSLPAMPLFLEPGDTS
jgi:hypothetical protein